MSGKADTHLSEEQILKAMVDEADLSWDLQEHLSLCQSCRARKDKILENLVSLGRIATCLSPSPRKKPVLPDDQRLRPEWFAWLWQRPLTASFAGLVVLALVAFPVYRKLHSDTQQMFSQEMLEDEKFMAEICKLEEDILPAPLADITSGERGSGEHLNYISPPSERDNV